MQDDACTCCLDAKSVKGKSATNEGMSGEERDRRLAEEESRLESLLPYMDALTLDSTPNRNHDSRASSVRS